MENIRFIKEITKYVDSPYIIVGDCLYYRPAENDNCNSKNIVKAYCVEAGVQLEVINTMHGLVDKVMLRFASYFEAVQCKPTDSFWYQMIEGGKHWRFEKVYPHTLPKKSDYTRLGKAMTEYIHMFF